MTFGRPRTWAGPYGQRRIDRRTRELEGLELATTRPLHPPDTRPAALRLGHIHEDFGEFSSHRIGHDTLRDRQGVAKVLRLDFDDQRFQMRLMVERPPPAVRRGEPALQRVRRQQLPARLVCTRRDAEGLLGATLTRGTPR
jgi:hypothetical protein